VIRNLPKVANFTVNNGFFVENGSVVVLNESRPTYRRGPIYKNPCPCTTSPCPCTQALSPCQHHWKMADFEKTLKPGKVTRTEVYHFNDVISN